MKQNPTMRALAGTLLLTCGAGVGGRALQAQEGKVSFAFEGSSIQIRVLTGGFGGSAEVVDEDTGEVTVRDRRGGTSLGLDNGVLYLENRSGASADYLIAVPANASISLAVDGRMVMAVAAAGGGRQLLWRWPGRGSEATGRVARPYADEAPEPERPPLRPFTVHAYGGKLVADSVDVGHSERIRALKIIVGGDRFRVSGDRSVRFGWYDKYRWGFLTPRVAEAEITLELPPDTKFFKLRVGDKVVWQYENGRGRAYCEPVAEIRDREGNLIWVFTPDAGVLTCPQDQGPLPA